MVGFLDIIFPKTCISCGKMGSRICEGCARKVKMPEKQRCMVCRACSEFGETHKHCSKKTFLSGAFYCLEYSGNTKKVIKAFKYGLEKNILQEFFSKNKTVLQKAEDYLSYLSSKNKEIIIEPIPLHKNRLRKRGFNQSLIIARKINEKTNIKISSNTKRILDTKTQASLKTKKQREENIQKSFKIEVRADIKGKTILLVDDVFSSGSTANELSKSLISAGAKKIFLFTLAHGS